MPYGDTGAPLYLPLYVDDEHNWGASMDQSLQKLNDAVGELQSQVVTLPLPRFQVEGVDTDLQTLLNLTGQSGILVRDLTGGTIAFSPDALVIQLKSEKGALNGYPALDSAGLVPLAQLPVIPPDHIAGGVSNAAGPSESLQYNAAGVFAGDSNLLWDGAAKLLKLGAGSGIAFGTNTAIQGDNDGLTLNATSSASDGIQFQIDNSIICEVNSFQGIGMNDAYGFSFSDVGFFKLAPNTICIGAGVGDTSGALALNELQAQTVITSGFADPSDNTKQLQLILSSIASGATRNLTIPNANSVTVRNSAAGANQFATGINASGVISYAQPSFANLSGSIGAAQLPNPTPTTLGGVKSLAAVTSKFLTSIGLDGTPVAAQPAFTDISGSLALGQLPGGGYPSSAWSSLQPATADLVLANAGFNTTFNQTSAVNWTWANTTPATGSVSQNSPLLIMGGRYWDGAASQVDSWSIQSVISGGTSGSSTLVFSHSGSSGVATIAIPPGGIFFSGSPNNPIQVSGGQLYLGGNTINVTRSNGSIVGGLIVNNTGYFGLQSPGAGTVTYLLGGGGNSNTLPMVVLGSAAQNPTSGLAICHSTSSPASIGFNTIFQPTSGTANWIAFLHQPQINQTGGANGTIRAFGVYPLNTALVGTEYLLSLGITTSGIANTSVLTDLFTVDMTGNLVQDNPILATASVSQPSPSQTMSGRYWTGAASATDQWTVQNIIAGGTNGTSQLTFTHSGTTGLANIVVPAVSNAPTYAFSGSQSTGYGMHASGVLGLYAGNTQIYFKNAATTGLLFTWSSASNYCGMQSALGASASLYLLGGMTTSTTVPAVHIAGSGMTATSGLQIGLNIGSGGAIANTFSFAPTTGSGAFIGCMVQPTINQTGTASGNVRVFGVYPLNTSLLGTEYLLSLGTSSSLTQAEANLTTVFTVDRTGALTQDNPTAATATVSQNSPIQTLSGRYWDGAASQVDSWTMQNVIASGTNGTSVLSISHTGSAGATGINIAGGGINLITTGGQYNFSGTNGATGSINIGGYTPINFNGNASLIISSSTRVNTSTVTIQANNGSGAAPQLNLLGTSSTLTAGTQTVVQILQTGGGFKPASGNANAVCLNLNWTINQTGTASGSYTGILVNVIETALLGTANKLLDLQAGAAGTTSKFAIDNSGKVIVPTTNTATTATAGASGAPPSQVVGYLIVNIGGTDRKIPYYAA